jgi:hypothetical protein
LPARPFNLSFPALPSRTSFFAVPVSLSFRAVPTSLRPAVDDAGRRPITAVAFEATAAEPALFVAVTRTRIRLPRWPAVMAKVAEVARWMEVQTATAASQACHW